MNSFLKSTKGQSVIEYFILLIVVVVVLIVALQPRGFVASGINERIIIEEDALDEYSRCVRFCGNEPCPPMCPNGCCEPGEDETTCQQDCAGCVPVSCDFEHCGVIADGCGQFIECPDCGCEKKSLEIATDLYGIFPRSADGTVVMRDCPENYQGHAIRICAEGVWSQLQEKCEVVDNNDLK